MLNDFVPTQSKIRILTSEREADKTKTKTKTKTEQEKVIENEGWVKADRRATNRIELLHQTIKLKQDELDKHYVTDFD